MAAVLVVDDEGDLLDTYERLLRRFGCQVTPARTRAGGLRALRSSRFELVVADRRLPDGDGLDLVRAARAAAPPPPVIVITGFVSGTSRHQALAAGASAYLAKPFTTASLSSLVCDMLQRGLPGTLQSQESR